MESSQRTSPDNMSQQMLKSERKDKYFFMHVITQLLYNVVYDGFKNPLFLV